jgi:hypothetical protein
MSQNTDTTSQTSTSEGVLAEVATALRGSVAEVRGRLVKSLTERELVKRVELLEKGLAKRTQLQSELNAIKPPVKKTFALVDGKMVEVQSFYTQEEVKKHESETKQYNKKLKEATEKLAKFEKLFDAALSGDPERLTESFAKLAKVVGGGAVDEEEKKEEE